MKPDGYLTNINTVISLDNSIKRAFFDAEYQSVIEEFSPNSAYFRTRYPSTDAGEAALLYISWFPKSETISTKSIEELTSTLFDALTLDDDAKTRVIRYVKNDLVHAGYMYNAKYNNIHFTILSVDKREMVRGYISINLSTGELREAFMNTFINNLKFEPYVPSRVNPEGQPRPVR